jgi:hypothetical protein
VPGGGGVHAHWCYPWVEVLVRCVDGVGGKQLWWWLDGRGGEGWKR